MGQYHPSVPIHEATFVASGKVIDQDRLAPAELNSMWVGFFQDLLCHGGGVMDHPDANWRLVVQHQTPSMALLSLALHNRCLASVICLTGQDLQQERILIYRFLRHLALLRRPEGQVPAEPNFELLSIRHRPLMAVIVFEGFDATVAGLALDISSFLGAAWFDLHVP